MRIRQAASTVVLLFFAFLYSAPGFADCSVTDDDHHLFSQRKPLRRVISLAPAITETIFAIGGGDSVVGVIQGSDFPQAAQHIPVVGSYAGIDLEKILSLRPDLIVVWGHAFARQLEVLKHMGIPVYVSDPRRISDIPRNMQNLGCLLDLKAKSRRAAEDFSQRLLRITKQNQHAQRLRVFYQIGPPALFTINKNSWIDQAISLCGGVNVFAGAHFAAPEVSMESVIAADPQVILSDAGEAKWISQWLKWPAISAVRNRYLFAVPADWIDRPGPRLADGVERVCQSLQLARSLP